MSADHPSYSFPAIREQERSRSQQLQHYLKSISSSGTVNRSTVRLAWKAWQRLAATMSQKLPVPVAGVGPDGEILFTWNKSDHHFELEIFLDKAGEFFYLNYSSNEAWEGKYEPGGDIPEEAVSKLRLFLLYE